MTCRSVCVIGCSGFVGSHVTAELLAQGVNVHGTLRDASPQNTGWLTGDVAAHAKEGAQLTLFSTNVLDKASLHQAMQGCDNVIVCAGTEKQEQATIDLMVGMANNICDLAVDLGMQAAVFTSSTGSTNPPGPEPALKNEIDHWSDPDLQLSANKFSPAAKTLMDKAVLNKMREHGNAFRGITINPSMIAGPCFSPNPVNSLNSFKAILAGDRMGDGVPNGSMSMINVQDLARLHIAAMENPQAKGRYFGVKKSWHWRDILAALARVVPTYQMPPIDPNEAPVRATTFDLSRQDSLGVDIRDLDDILIAVVEELHRREMI
jgi:nucleoside-diphosphate-sugar epimerase